MMEKMIVHLFTDDVPNVHCDLPPNDVQWAMGLERAARYGLLSVPVRMNTVVGWREVIACSDCVMKVVV